MSSSGIAEFLIELNENESLIALRAAHSQRSFLTFKLDDTLNKVQARIENFTDKRAILSAEISPLKISSDKEVSMRFNVGTEVYFVKTFIKSHLNRYYFDMSSKVIQLKRRKEPRYLIPKKWPQTATVQPTNMIHMPIRSQVLDISNSGIRFEVSASKITFKRDDIVKIKFQIHKRAEIATTAIVRFALRRPDSTTILGLEFSDDMTRPNKDRIINIIEDMGITTSR